MQILHGNMPKPTSNPRSKPASKIQFKRCKIVKKGDNLGLGAFFGTVVKNSHQWSKLAQAPAKVS